MWIVFVFLYLWLLRSAVSSSPPSPIDVSFSSVNLKNVLHWSPGNGTPDDVHFTVQYAIYGDSVEGSRRVRWRKVRQCMKTVRNWCDLSNQTWDLEHGYYARVRAVGRTESSKWALTQLRFDPQSDTSFGPPLVSVAIEDNSALVTLKGPMRYQLESNTPMVSMATFYPQITYNLSIHNTRRDQRHHFIVDSSSYTYRMMDYETEYCFSAKARLPVMPIQCRSSEWHCITTPQDPVMGQLQRMIVGIVVPSLCLCALLVVCYFLCNYVTGKGQKSPYILNPPSFHPPPLTFTNTENPNIIVITIAPSPVIEPAGPLGPQPPPRYSAQGDVTPPEPVEPWDDLLIDYGGVSVACNVDVMGKENDGEDGNEPRCTCQTCAAGNNRYEKKQWRPGFYDPQAKPRLPMRTTALCARARSQLHSGFTNKIPQTGHINVSYNPQTNEVGIVKRPDAKLDGGGESEEVPLLSAYASQTTIDSPPLHPGQAAFLPNDYGVVCPAAARAGHGGGGSFSEEEEGTVCINWDPETRKLVVPEVNMEFNKQRGADEPGPGETGSRDELRLENVFVRQSSVEEREAGALREAGSGRDAGREMDEFVSKWKLIISADQ